MDDFSRYKLLKRLAWGLYFLLIFFHATNEAYHGKPPFKFLIEGFFVGEPWSKERFLASFGTLFFVYGWPILCVYLSATASCVYGSIASNVIEKVISPPKK